jgi:two-component SAPR family response regulator
LENKNTPGSPLKFVIIDDDDITIFLTTRILRQFNENFEIESYKDGKLAIQQFLETGYQQDWIILLDINMPIYNGWDFLEDIEKHHMNMRIFMFSSSIDTRDQEKSKAFPFVLDYISKPLTGVKIAQLLSKL